MGPYANQNVGDINVLTGEMRLERCRPPTRMSHELESVDSEAALGAEIRWSASTEWMDLSPNAGV